MAWVNVPEDEQKIAVSWVLDPPSTLLSSYYIAIKQYAVNAVWKGDEGKIV